MLKTIYEVIVTVVAIHTLYGEINLNENFPNHSLALLMILINLQK